MAKYLAVMIAVLGTLVAVNSVEARGRRGGCAGGNCYTGGGCPGGVCYAPVAKGPVAQAPVVQVPPKATVAAPAAPAAASVPVTRTTPRYTTTSGRRWFGRRS